MLTTQTFVVGHNSDGSKSFNFSVTYNVNVTYSSVEHRNKTASGTGTLNQITRASSLTFTPSIANVNSTDITFNIASASSSFRHDVYWSWNKRPTWVNGQWGYFGSSKRAGGQFTAKVPSLLYDLMPRSNNSWIYVYLDTYTSASESTPIGTKEYRLDIRIPVNISPTMRIDSTVTEYNPKVSSVLGDTSYWFLQSVSKIQVGVYVDYEKLYGTNAGDLTFTVSMNDVVVKSDKVSEYIYINLSSYSSLTEKNRIKATVTDGRGHSTLFIDKEIVILPYSPPSVTSFFASRNKNNQTLLDCSMNGSVQSIKKYGDNTELNTYTAKISILPKNGGWVRKFTESNNITSNTQISGLSILNSYTVWYGIEDALGYTGEFYLTISTAKTLMSFNKDIGVGVGKIHERGVADFGGHVYSDGGFYQVGQNPGIEMNSSFSRYSNDVNSSYYPQLIVSGNVAHLMGAVKNSTLISAGTNYNIIGSIPNGWQPRRRIDKTVVIGDDYIGTLTLGTDRTISISRIMKYTSSGFSNLPAGSFISIDCTYITNDW